MSVRKAFASVTKLAALTTSAATGMVIALLRGDTERAAVQARILAAYFHMDLVRLVVLIQEKLVRRPPSASSVDRVLIIKLDRIGDMVNATPVLDALQAMFPGARLDLVGHPSTLSLLAADDRISTSFPYKSWLYHPLPPFPPGPRAMLLLFRLMRRRYPLVVVLRGSPLFLPLALTSRLAAIRFIEGQPVVERNLKALESVFGPVPRFRPRLAIERSARRFVRDLLDQGESRAGPIVVIHPGSASPTRMWPVERFAALADRLHEELDARIIVLGTASELPTLEVFKANTRHVHAVYTNLRLAESVALIAASDLFIGNDSGLSHVAAAVDTPAVVLWGAANLSMSRPSVEPERCAILYHDVPCRATCPELFCANSIHLECLTRIQVEEAVQSARRLLREDAQGASQGASARHTSEQTHLVGPILETESWTRST
jgi:ADP-heptose:LPS heptosyltransferase